VAVDRDAPRSVLVSQSWIPLALTPMIIPLIAPRETNLHVLFYNGAFTFLETKE